MELVEQDVPTVLGRIRIRVGGAGPVIVFWPSLLMDGTMWAAQAEHFAATHRVVLVDPPGHGGSEPLTRLFEFSECAHVVAQVLDHVGAADADYVGNSWGGMIGATFAARFPDRVRTAVLMNCTVSRAPFRQKVEFGLLTRAARLAGGIRGPLVGPCVDAFVGPTTKAERPQVVETIRAALGRVDIASARWAVTSVVPRRPDQRALAAEIRAKVVVVAGIEDATFPVAETRVMADAIPGARFVVLDDTAHLAALENPVEVNALIEEVIR
ncbi:alpha/beta fold hydrolase [Umezawaea endophytica]|uniref:Alpha/beta fold hydrolase n=1 Tax=Umezawaea endophytica TaxID=1654476 RepID=A0A9X2VIN9_9PSEU|nr:alpha/beta fold hydrolase [Umezawaea endophytica]MCS7477425.1 alpha/beta fold hydrolase [Umezawaea endophytica]